MTQNYFQGTQDHPYHISIGAVVRNAEGKVCCHYFDSLKVNSLETFDNIHYLMRETIEPNETIEGCLARGLMEEFGMTATLNTYIGAVLSKFNVKNTNVIVEKNTLYFLCDFVSQDDSLRSANDPEFGSQILWLEPADLIPKMKEQGHRLGREDADESAILENLLKMA